MKSLILTLVLAVVLVSTLFGDTNNRLDYFDPHAASIIDHDARFVVQAAHSEHSLPTSVQLLSICLAQAIPRDDFNDRPRFIDRSMVLETAPLLYPCAVLFSAEPPSILPVLDQRPSSGSCSPVSHVLSSITELDCITTE